MADKISSLQSLSDYGLGDSDIEDSDNENEQNTTKKLPIVNSAPFVPAAPRVVTTSARLVSYGGEEDDDELAASLGGGDTIVVEDKPESEATMETKENSWKESENKDGNENNVQDDSQSFSLRITSPNIVLPPEPTGRCSMSLQDRIKTFLEKKRNGVDLNKTIQKRKDFRNPSIYEKLVSFLKIKENGTNYPPSLFDPEAWAKEPSYEALAKIQKEAYEKKEKERAKRTQIEFLSGTKKPTVPTTTGGDESKKRKSKWDITAVPSVLPDASKKPKN